MADVPTTDEKKTCCLPNFDNVDVAKGYNALGIARGPIVMSNIFLSSSLIYLGTQAAGGEDQKIYGFLPGSLVVNIAVASGLLSAFLVPFFGALIDLTPHRRLVGIMSAALIIIIQAIQIFTLPATWFVMAILQGITGFIYQIQVLATYSYLPDISRMVGEVKMTQFTSIWVITQFASSLIFLVGISGVSLALGYGDVQIAMLSQAVNVVWSGAAVIFGWKLMSHVPPLRGGGRKNLCVASTSQLLSTVKGINKYYGSTLRWYFLATMFAEAGYNAFSVVAVTYLKVTLGFNGAQIGILMAVVYVSTLIGARLGHTVTSYTNPVTSWKYCHLIFIVFTVSGSLVLDSPARQNYAYIWGVLWGLGLGWHYPTENLIFSCIIPKGQETELTGFFVYCTQIIVWLPPMIFTAVNESGASMQYALMTLNIFFFIAAVFLQIMPKWGVCAEQGKTQSLMVESLESDEVQEKDVTDDGDLEIPEVTENESQ